MVWNIKELVKEKAGKIENIKSGAYFLCPNCLTLNSSAEVVVYSEYKEWWTVAPLEDGIDWVECVDSESTDDSERGDYTYMKECDCEVSSGYPEDYIVYVDVESRTIKAVGDYWQNEGYDDLVKFAQKNGFQVVS